MTESAIADHLTPVMSPGAWMTIVAAAAAVAAAEK